MTTVYYSIIYSHLIYAIQVWGSAFKTNLQPLEILLKRAVWMITFNDTFTSEGNLVHFLPLFCELGLLKVQEVYKLQIARFVYDCLKNHAPSQFNNWFTYVSE